MEERDEKINPMDITRAAAFKEYTINVVYSIKGNVYFISDEALWSLMEKNPGIKMMKLEDFLLASFVPDLYEQVRDGKAKVVEFPKGGRNAKKNNPTTH